MRGRDVAAAERLQQMLVTAGSAGAAAGVEGQGHMLRGRIVHHTRDVKAPLLGPQGTKFRQDLRLAWDCGWRCRNARRRSYSAVASLTAASFTAAGFGGDG